MSKRSIKLSPHARQRLLERKSNDIKYNTRDVLKSNCRWYKSSYLIPTSKLYQHSRYVCRKSPQLGYITNGDVEILYNKGTGVAITVLEVKNKFKPVTQYIKPEIIKADKIKKERKEMGRKLNELGTCPDCGEKNVPITHQGICRRCMLRKSNALYQGRPYVPYINLSEEDKARIDRMRKKASEKAKKDAKVTIRKESETKPILFKKEEETSKPSEEKNTIKEKENIDVAKLTEILKECGCEISNENLLEVLKVLLATDMMKDVIMTIVKDDNQKALLDLEQMLNVCERKLQHVWEYDGFKEEDDKKFKDFLVWRRQLKGAIFFWKKLYQSNALIELQRAWTAYQADPNDKIIMEKDKGRTESELKRYQITTETVSTIFNTRRPFTRVFYAVSEEAARDKFTKWLSVRQLHEDKTKTTVVELNSDDNK